MLTALPVWQSKLKEKIKEAMPKVAEDLLAVTKAWQDWIGEVGKGMETSPLYSSFGTANKTAFAPLIMPPAATGTAAMVATAYALAWFNWYMAIMWSPHNIAKVPLPMPAPPFQTIIAITSSAAGAATQQTVLMTKLTALLLKPSKEDKYDQMAQYFYMATIQSGVMISGILLPAPAPLPLVIPQWPIL